MKEHKYECRKAGIDTSFLKYFVPKKTRATSQEPKGVPFVCCHNKCGFLSRDDCDEGLDCCHHIFQIMPGIVF